MRLSESSLVTEIPTRNEVKPPENRHYRLSEVMGVAPNENQAKVSLQGPEESKFQDWYSSIAKERGLNPNPDDPLHFYDYRAAFKAGEGPDETGHWPSEFKLEGHPRMVLDGVNTKTGEKVPSNKDDNFVSASFQSLTSGLAKFNAGISRIPGLAARAAYDFGSIPQNIVAGVTGWNIGAKAPDWMGDNEAARIYDRASESYSYKNNKFKGETMGSLMEKGNYVDAGEYIYHSVIENAPISLTAIAGAYAGIPTVANLSFLGAHAATGTFIEAKEKNVGELKAMTGAIVNGGLEAAWESAGTFGLLKWGEELFKTVGKQSGKAILKNVLKYTVGSAIGEGNEELWTQLTQDYSNKILGIEDIPWKSFMSRALEAGVLGAASGVAMTTPGGISMGLREAEISNNIKSIEETLAKHYEKNPDLVPLRKKEEATGPAKEKEAVAPSEATPAPSIISSREVADEIHLADIEGRLPNLKNNDVVSKEGDVPVTHEQIMEKLKQIKFLEKASGIKKTKKGGGQLETDMDYYLQAKEEVKARIGLEEARDRQQLSVEETNSGIDFNPEELEKIGNIAPIAESIVKDTLPTTQSVSISTIKQQAKELRKQFMEDNPNSQVPYLSEFEKIALEMMKMVSPDIQISTPDKGFRDAVQRATGQSLEIGPVVPETEAYKEALRYAQEAVNIALHKSGVEFRKEKRRIRSEHKKELRKAEVSQRKALREQRRDNKEATKLFRRIEKSDIENITAEARVKINELQKTLKNTKTLDGLRRLNDKIQAIKEEGKHELAVARDYRNQVFEATKETLIKTADMVKPPKPVTAIVDKVKTNYLKVLRLMGLRPSRIFDSMDGGQDFKGPFHSTYYDQVNQKNSDEVRMIGLGTERGIDIQSRNGITGRDLGKTMTIDGITLSYDKACHIYGGFSNKETREAIAFGNHIGIETQIKIIEALPDNFKKATDEIIEEMGPNNYDRLRIAFLEFTDGKEDLGKVEGSYIPIKRESYNYESTEKEIADELLHRKGLKKAFAERSFTKGRINIPEEFQTPIKLGLFETYYSHVVSREHFINTANLIKELQRLNSDAELSRKISNQYGNEYMQEIKKYVNRIANPNIYRSHDGLEKLVRAMRERSVIVNLGFNLVTMAKQTPSLLLALGEVGPMELMGGISAYISNFDEMNKFIDAKDPQMKNRSIERELEERKRVSPSGPDSVIRSIDDASLKGIMLFDKLTVRAIWIAKYNQMKSMGLSENESIDAAQKAILRTQPASSAKDIASLYSTNEFLNVFLQFTNQLNQIYNIATYDIPANAKRGNYEKALMQGLGLALNSVAIFIMTTGRLPLDGEDLGESFLNTFISMIPLFGPMLNAWRHGFDNNPASFEVIKKTGGLAKHTYDFVATGKKKAITSALDDGLYMAAFGYKVPFTQVRRSLLGILEYGSGGTEDLRRLIWSEGALKKKKKGGGRKL